LRSFSAEPLRYARSRDLFDFFPERSNARLVLVTREHTVQGTEDFSDMKKTSSR
jgi:hypothetical protein